MSVATHSVKDVAALWLTARRLYPVYLALDSTFSLGLGACKELEDPVDRGTPDAVERIFAWFDALDKKVAANHLRQVLQTTHFGSEETLQLLIQRHLERRTDSQDYRDKVDFLLVQYLAMQSPNAIHENRIELKQVADVLRPFVGIVDVNSLDAQPFEAPLIDLQRSKNFEDLLQRRVLENARMLKMQLGQTHLDAGNLVMVTRMSFLFRLGFVKLLHQDLQHFRSLLQALAAAGVETLDLSSAGLSNRESIVTLHRLYHGWKQPYHEAYAAGKGTPFGKMPAIMHLMEVAVANPPKPGDPAPVAAVQKSAAAAAAVPAQPSVSDGQDAPGVFTIERCIAHIEQALQDSPKQANSVIVGGSRFLLSSWESNAFLAHGNATNQALERAVAARIILFLTLAHARQGGSGLKSAISMAHNEAALMQARIAEAKERNDIDGAVALAATGKRLLSLLEEAEKECR